MSACKVLSDKLPYYSGIVCGFCRRVITVSKVWSQVIQRTMALNNIQDRDLSPLFPLPHLTQQCPM